MLRQAQARLRRDALGLGTGDGREVETAADQAGHYRARRRRRTKQRALVDDGGGAAKGNTFSLHRRDEVLAREPTKAIGTVVEREIVIGLASDTGIAGERRHRAIQIEQATLEVGSVLRAQSRELVEPAELRQQQRTLQLRHAVVPAKGMFCEAIAGTQPTAVDQRGAQLLVALLVGQDNAPLA